MIRPCVSTPEKDMTMNARDALLSRLTGGAEIHRARPGCWIFHSGTSGIAGSDTLPEPWRDLSEAQIAAQFGAPAWITARPWEMTYTGIDVSTEEGEAERINPLQYTGRVAHHALDAGAGWRLVAGGISREGRSRPARCTGHDRGAHAIPGMTPLPEMPWARPENQASSALSCPCAPTRTSCTRPWDGAKG